MINIILSVMSLISNASVNQPVLYTELRNVSVMIVNKQMNSGGTGSILQSSKESLVLTNKHVCQVVEAGGYVIKGKLKAKVVEYKEYTRHDLCIIKVNGNLGVSLKLSPMAPKNTETSMVSGYPRLMPNTITKGHFSDLINVQVMMDLRECTMEEMLTDMECIFFGGKAVVQSFQAQHTSNLIQPGNSGSGVFNDKGELAGVVFAGSGEISWALIVPHSYVKDFVDNHKSYDWIIPNPELQEDEFIDEESDLEKMLKACKTKRCKKLKSDMIHRG